MQAYTQSFTELLLQLLLHCYFVICALKQNTILLIPHTVGHYSRTNTQVYKLYVNVFIKIYNLIIINNQLSMLIPLQKHDIQHAEGVAHTDADINQHCIYHSSQELCAFISRSRRALETSLKQFFLMSVRGQMQVCVTPHRTTSVYQRLCVWEMWGTMKRERCVNGLSAVSAIDRLIYAGSYSALIVFVQNPLVYMTGKMHTSQ